MAKTIVEFKGKKFVLEYEPKAHRAIHGTPTSRGVVGGVGEQGGLALLAEYDRLGGFISLNGKKVAHGSFYDLKLQKPKTEKEVAVAFAKKPTAKNAVEHAGDVDGDNEDESDEDDEDSEEESADEDEEEGDEDADEGKEGEEEKKKPAKKK